MADWLKCDDKVYRTKLMRTVFEVGPYGDSTSDVYWELNRTCTVETLVKDIAKSLKSEFGKIRFRDSKHDDISFGRGEIHGKIDKTLAKMPVKFVWGKGGWGRLDVYIYVSDGYEEYRAYKDYMVHKDLPADEDGYVEREEGVELKEWSPIDELNYNQQAKEEYVVKEFPEIDDEFLNDDLIDFSPKTDESGNHYYNLRQFASANDVCKRLAKIFKYGHIIIRPLLLNEAPICFQATRVIEGEQTQELRGTVSGKFVVKVGFSWGASDWTFTLYYI